MSTVKGVLQQATDTLSTRPEINASLEAGLLLAYVLDKDRSWLYAWPEKVLTADQEQDFTRLIDRRIAGEPVAYLTGQREFWSLNFLVTPDTLIPRPETELLVSLALSLGNEETRVLDLGTGSGAIAIAIASEKPGWQVTATDQSPGALQVATKNASLNRTGNVTLLRSNWYGGLEPDNKFHIIVSNPPYVSEGDHHLKRGDLRFEPATALSSGSDGLNDLRTIIAGAPDYLENGGHLLVEHGMEQGNEVRSLFAAAGFQHIKTTGDLENRERVTWAQIQ